MRRSFNNIFIDVEPTPDRQRYSTVFLPSPAFRGPTDGNCMHQLGGNVQPLLQHGAAPAGGRVFADLASYCSGVAMDSAAPSTHFQDSETQYPPGFEANSIDVDPLMRRIDPTGVAQFDDDLRLQPGSLAIDTGHPGVAPEAMIDFGELLAKQGDVEGLGPPTAKRTTGAPAHVALRAKLGMLNLLADEVRKS